MPRIYVADLGAYNNGILHGCWIDADQDADDIGTEITAMLRDSPCPNVEVKCNACEGTGRRKSERTKRSTKCAQCKGGGQVPSGEEFAIHDSEGFEDMEIGAGTSIEEIALHGPMIAKHDGAWCAYVGLVGSSHATEEDFDERYEGEYKSAAAYAEERVADQGILRSLGDVANYIDWERYASDMESDGHSFITGGRGVYVFGSS
jgi:antirestriction protein